MTQEDKDLILRDLCARLPYRPIVKCKIVNLREEQHAKDSHPSHIVHPTYEGNGYLYSVNILSQSVGIRPILKHLEYKEQVYFEKICNDGYINIEDVKPYLRPLSSMTEEEKRELQSFFPGSFGNQWLDVEAGYIDIYECESTIRLYLYDANRLIDWLNKKMFDYRGLIPIGCALSTEAFNPY